MAKEKGAYWLEHRDYKIDLSLSRNPLGCSPQIKKTVNLKTVDVSRYPEDAELKKALSRHFKISEKNIVVGSGIDYFINLFPQVFLQKKDSVLMPKLTFPRFEVASRAFGGKVILVPMKKELGKEKMRVNFSILEREIKNKKPKLTFIANPNNPTGLLEKKKDLLNIVKKSKGLVIVDEAGIDLVGEKHSLIKEAGKFKNLVVLRGFSKGHGLSGLRVGFCVAHPTIIFQLNPIHLTFPVSSVAMKAAEVALLDQKHLQKTQKLFQKEGRFFYQNLEGLGFQVLFPESNLILAQVPSIFSSAQELIEALHSKDVHCVDGRFFDLPQFIRINPASRKINQEFIRIIKEIIKEKNEK